MTMRKLYTLFALLSVAVMLHAVPANPAPFVYTLEDGTEVMAILHGDEFHSYITDLDGNLLKGSPVPTEEQRAMRRAHRMPAATQVGGNFPLKGSPKSVAILVNFKDKQFQHTREDFYALLNESGYSRDGSTGSCRDYFIACSDSLFSPVFDVWGPYTVSGKMADYGAEKNGQHDTDPGAAFIEACQLAAEAGVDFSQYDTDGDGVIDNVFFYYAGNNQAEGASSNTIWPHQSSLQYRNITLNGKQLASYACTSEMYGLGNTMCHIGTFCHEFGHVLGLPDFYDTDDSDGSQYTVGNWDIMAGGNYNNMSRTPPTYSGYERFYLGWRKPVQLTEPGRYTIAPLADGGEIYLIADGKHNLSARNPSPTEFFMMELRERVGWDAPDGALVNTGILIWHIDYSAQAWAGNTLNNGTPLRYHLEEAGGHRGSSSMTDPYPGTSKVTAFTPVLHNGTTLATQPVYDINVAGGMGNFIYVSLGEQHLHAYPAELEIETTIGANGKAQQWQAAEIHLVGEQLSPDEVFTLTVPTKNQFKMTFDPTVATNRTSTKWKSQITLSDAVNEEGKLDTILYVNFNPQKQNCDEEAATITIQSDLNRLAILLHGYAPRHTYVTTPVLKEETEITPYSFVAHWTPVEDAWCYYMTLFRSEKGESEMVQDFENFNSTGSIIEQGWSSNFVATTSAYTKDGKYALMLKNNGNQFTTEQYQAALSGISFYLNAFTADVDTIGELIIEASQDGTTWDQVEELRVPARTKNKLFRVTLDVEKAYTQVRCTYWDNGGNGLAMDQFTAILSEKITYLYRGQQLSISGDDQYHVDVLSPNTTYHYQIQCTDGSKGCVEHITPLSPVRTVTTLDGEAPDSKQLTIAMDTINYDRPTHTIYLADTKAGDRLMFYDAVGQLVHIIYLGDYTHAIPLPLERFNAGHPYIIKHVRINDGGLKRKQNWAKIIF